MAESTKELQEIPGVGPSIARTLELEVHDLIPKATEIISTANGHNFNDKVRNLIQSSTEGEEDLFGAGREGD